MASNTLGWSEWGTNLTNGDGVTRPTSFAAETAATTDPTFRLNTELFGQQSTDNLTNALAESGRIWSMEWAGGGDMDWGSVIGGALNAFGGMQQGNAASDAAQAQAQAQLQAAQIAADSARFRPVGMTTGFGTSGFKYDAQGNLVGAGYELTPQLQSQRNRLLSGSEQPLQQYLDAQQATAPMAQGAQTMFGLGSGYLSTSPQEQAQKYYNDQQALLATNRSREQSNLENRLQQQGRLGLATGATGMMGAANPEMEAFYNAQRQQDMGLAANATQGGMDYAKFGAGMLTGGADMLNSMYGTQSAAYNPYATMFGAAQGVEKAGQGALDLSTAIGGKQATAGANAGQLYQVGAGNAANSMYNANAYSPTATLLSGAGNMISNYNYAPTTTQQPVQTQSQPSWMQQYSNSQQNMNQNNAANPSWGYY